MDELALIKDACNGDLDAFNHLVLAYQDIAFNLAYRLLGEDAPAEDAAQTAFIAAYRNLSTYRGGSFKAWILRIVTNTCYDELRRRRRHPTTSLEIKGEEDDDIDEPRWMADDHPSPETVIESEEIAQAIQSCLDNLPDDFRAVAVLIDVQGIDYDEASTILKKPLGTIKSRLARARARLRHCLSGYEELFPEKQRLDHES